MQICVNPSCCNVDTFDSDRCPYCGDVCTVDTLTYMRALSDSEAMTELVSALDTFVEYRYTL
jgi:hypothetical protein